MGSWGLRCSFKWGSGANKGLTWWLSGKESTCHAGDTGSIPGSGRSPGVGNGNTLQYSCLKNSMDRGAWATVHGVRKSDTSEQLSMHDWNVLDMGVNSDQNKLGNLGLNRLLQRYMCHALPLFQK